MYRAIQKVSSGELHTNKQCHKKFILTKIHVVKLILNLVMTRTEAVDVSGNKSSINSLLLKCCDLKQLLR
jgi:hypothetical protein